MKACSIIHNMSMEYREIHGDKGTKILRALTRLAKWLQSEPFHLPSDPFEISTYFRDSADSIEDQRDNLNLQDALVDAFWSRHGGEDED